MVSAKRKEIHLNRGGEKKRGERNRLEPMKPPNGKMIDGMTNTKTESKYLFNYEDQ
jgi:hypothetical protein